jgi:hypothetical protein
MQSRPTHGTRKRLPHLVEGNLPILAEERCRYQGRGAEKGRQPLSPPQHIDARARGGVRRTLGAKCSSCCDVNVSVRLRSRIIDIVFLCCLTVGCGFRSGNKVLIPDGYIGWVRIYYGEAGAPSFRKEGTAYVVKVNESGSSHISSLRESGYGIDEYFYVSSAGVRTKLKLQGMEDQQDDVIHDFTYQSAPKEITLFFVGPRTSVKTYPRPTLAP